MRTLVHETWGNHQALIARNNQSLGGSVGYVKLKNKVLATPDRPLGLQYGGRLEHLTLAYESYGELNAKADNAILICHALTGSAHVAGLYQEESVPGWWDPLIGPGKPIDTNKYFVLCSNILGGCYGSTGPTSLNPQTGEAYRLNFPRYTIRDMVEAQKRLMEALGIQSWAAVIGGSMGGMQVLEWAAMYPHLVRAIVPIGIGARHSA
ncbi:MAG: alpha/beta fold hydrolase [Deinococcales bacterium]